MTTEISKVMPQLQRLAPTLTQWPRLYSGDGEGFSAWIRKSNKRVTHWDAICIEYEIGKQDSAQVTAALAWLSNASGIDSAKIDTARKRPRNQWNFQENGDGWILSTLNFVTTISVRVDAIDEK